MQASSLESINCVLLGAKASGKSTLIGYLMNREQTTNNPIEIKVSGAKSGETRRWSPMNQFVQSYGLDYDHMYHLLFHKTRMEAELQTTLELGFRYFRTERKEVTVFDTPSRADKLKFMQQACVMADIAILVVDASESFDLDTQSVVKD